MPSDEAESRALSMDRRTLESAAETPVVVPPSWGVPAPSFPLAGAPVASSVDVHCSGPAHVTCTSGDGSGRCGGFSRVLGSAAVGTWCSNQSLSEAEPVLI